MKRTKKFLAMFLALALASTLMACGSSKKDTNSGEQAASSSATQDAAAESEASREEAAGEKRSVVFLVPNLGDMGFLDNAWDGIQELAKQHDYDVRAIEMGLDSSAYEAALLDALDSGDYDVFISETTGGMSDLMLKYAAEYPEYDFVVFDVGRDFQPTTDNLIAVSYKQNEGSYLGGVLAALLSKSGSIGIYLHLDGPVLNDFATGFYQGARDVNPDIKIYTAYGAGLSGDSARAAELTSIMFNNGVDVVYGVAGSSNPGLFQNVLNLGGPEAGYYAIGVDYDQWFKYTNSDSPEMADAIVSSVVKNTGDSLIAVWNGLESGEYSFGETVFFGINEDSTGIAKNEYYEAVVPAEIKAKVGEYEEKVRSGEVEVKSYFDFTDHDEFLDYQAETAG